MAMDARQSRSPHVQQVLLELLPRLASFDPRIFIADYLDASVEFVVAYLMSKERDKTRAFIAIGLLAVIAKDRMQPHVRKIFAVVCNCFPQPTGAKSG
jgi:FKBP12-rapamycin complex-associated protein